MPLTKKSTDSMKKMQELAPEVKKLQVKYKDKPDVLQKETMKLYKDNKVNPMGGCLPLLLQMPFFFALYSALINSIDLWNAPFMLWIKDLSMPDTVATISGFDINILPLLMTVSTIIQQKQTMVDTGNQQQKIMMYMMPVILLFIFWTMPSGLVLYWFLQNLYQIVHQYVVNKIGKTA
jgi:YidC/Oxa1 family membrane protein insertase